MLRLLALGLALLAFAGCGGDRTPASVVPADATIYVGMDDSEAERLLMTISSGDFDFERDVRPWLGERIAYFADATGDESGLVLDADDDDEAAEAFARKAIAAGPYRASAMIDGHLVLASRALLQAVKAAADGRSLADSTRLDVAGEDEDGAPDVLLATETPRAFVSGLELFDILPSELPMPGTELVGDGALTARVWSERGHERVEVRGLPPQRAAAPSLADAPSAAWLAVATADLGETLTLFGGRRDYAAVERWAGIDLDRAVLPHLGPGTYIVQGRSPLDVGARLVAETSDEQALRREMVALARRLGPRQADLNVNRPGADERFLQLAFARRGLGHAGGAFLQIQDGRVHLDLGAKVGGVVGDLGDTPLYRDAERQLGGAPTLLRAGDPTGYLAARDHTEDGRRVLQIVNVWR